MRSGLDVEMGARMVSGTNDALLPKAEGVFYHDFLSALHQEILFDWYLEIGSRKGDSFAPVRSKTIAVDPFFRLRGNVMNAKRMLLLCQMTSDEFFEGDFLKALSARLSLSFLDGMHLFEYLLRDFMHAEANSHPEGVIVMHDCVPYTPEMTTRDLDNLPKGDWTGDVWKLLPILRTHRPDLKVEVLDAAPTGLVVVSGLNPKNRVLKKRYDEIVEAFTPLTLAEYGVARFAGEVEFQSTAAVMAQGFPVFRPLAQDPESLTQPRRLST